MNLNPEITEIDLLYVIVHDGQGDKVMKIAKKNGALGGTIFLGQGTITSSKHRGITSLGYYKEIILIACHRHVALNIIRKLDQKIKLYKPNHGIAFTISLVGACGSKKCIFCTENNHGGDEKPMYQSIIIIVEKGKAEDIVDIASKAGANGATIINARGAGIHETSKIFNIEIEPEKEIVLIIVKEELTNTIISSIKTNFNIDKPGNGVLFVQNINQVYGLYD